MRRQNFFNHRRKLPEGFWTGTTSIPPIDNAIHKALSTAYNHHIERLMVLGNFMLLTKTNPHEVYRWFMAMFIDAYDWVMVPNVYGMIAYADDGLMTTKPYISSSNYVLKMSDYEKGAWCEIWDGLYWNFIHTNKPLLAGNRRMSMMVHLLDKMSPEKLQQHLAVAEKYLSELDKNA
jgi:deoxyribodipyrimidine photolyase-related protein